MMLKNNIIRNSWIFLLIIFLILSVYESAFADFEGRGILEVRSIPSGKEVFIDKVYVGRTAFKREDFRPGSYQVRVRGQGKEQEALVIVNPDTRTIVTFRFIQSSQIGYLIDDQIIAGDPRGSQYTVINFNIPPPESVNFIPINIGPSSSLQLEKLRRDYSLDGFLYLKVQKKRRTTPRDVQVTLNAELYDFNQDKSIYKKRFVSGGDFDHDPKPSDIDSLRLDVYREFSQDFSKFLKKEASSLRKSSSVRKPEIKNVPLQGTPLVVPPAPEVNILKEWALPDYSGTPFQDLIGTKAPQFRLKGRLGKITDSTGYIGKQVVLLYFFDASFDFCQRELDELAKLKVLHEKKFTPIGICLALKGKRRRTAENFLRRRIYPFPVAFDTSNIAKKYNARNVVPLWVLIDRNSKIRYIRRGTWSIPRLYERIQYLYLER